MKYKGIELKEVTEPQLFDPPKKMFVLDSEYGIPVERLVYAITNRKRYPIVTTNTEYNHCANIPESPLATYRELSRWLAEGKGEMKICEYSTCQSLSYMIVNENKPVPEHFRVRKWSDTEWHKPTMEYLGLEDK